MWNAAPSNEYPDIYVFAQRLKLAIIAAYDNILAAKVKQTQTANRQRQ